MEFFIIDDHVSPWYLLYKIALSIFFVTGYSLGLKETLQTKPTVDCSYHTFMRSTWIYLTHWSFILMIGSFMYNTILVIMRFGSEHRGSPKVFNRWYERDHFSTMLSWALSSTAGAVAICVTAAYWTALYNPKEAEKWTPVEKFDNFNVHLLQVWGTKNMILSFRNYTRIIFLSNVESFNTNYRPLLPSLMFP